MILRNNFAPYVVALRLGAFGVGNYAVTSSLSAPSLTRNSSRRRLWCKWAERFSAILPSSPDFAKQMRASIDCPQGGSVREMPRHFPSAPRLAKNSSRRRLCCKWEEQFRAIRRCSVAPSPVDFVGDGAFCPASLPLSLLTFSRRENTSCGIAAHHGRRRLPHHVAPGNASPRACRRRHAHDVPRFQNKRIPQDMPALRA